MKWMPHYAQALGLNIEHGVTAQNIQYDETKKEYSVELKSDRGVGSIRCNHVVLATGLVSDVPNVPDFPGRDTFKGEVLHSSAYQSGSLISDIQDKKITIIGCGTSGHDIAKDLVDHGAENVTMVQRKPMYVLSLDSLEKFQLALWNTPGLSTNDADVLGSSFPTIIARTLGIGMSQAMAANDKEMLDGLEKAGMVVKSGDKGDSLLDHQLILGGHFYIDQGASPMVIDGRIKVIQNDQGVTSFYDNGMILGDGQKMESDLVIMATGFVRSNSRAKSLMGKAAKGLEIATMGRLDESQERVGVSSWPILVDD
jgi:cation diffusion facilitator CzcD-associated flavoprotein CzcO